MTLTARLSAFFLATLAAVLLAFSGALYGLADRHLHRRLEDRLAASVRTLASAAEVEPDGVEWEPHTHPLGLTAGPFGDDLRWAVADDSGAVIDRSPQPDVEPLLVAAAAAFGAGHRNPRRLDHGGRAWEVARLRLASADRPGGPPERRPGRYAALVLTAAVPLEPVRGELRALALALAGLTAAVLAAALVAVRAVCRRALAPVVRMADAARAMGAADLTHRLPAPPARDELAELARAFNGLLDRLAEAFERERRFAGEASHQLRTPLTALIGQLEVALRRDRDAAEYRRVLGTALEQAARLRRVVEALLFLARSAVDARLPEVDRVDLAAWVPTRLRAWADHPRAADVAFAGPAQGVPAAIHPDLFGELLDALLDNALKYSAAGTPVVVRVGCEAGSGWVEVEDRGCGIAAEDVPHLFRPFFRSESARRRGVPGVGLGLAVAARVAAALGGAIAVESEPGKGTRVRVRLPAVEQRVASLGAGADGLFEQPRA